MNAFASPTSRIIDGGLQIGLPVRDSCKPLVYQVLQTIRTELIVVVYVAGGHAVSGWAVAVGKTPWSRHTGTTCLSYESHVLQPSNLQTKVEAQPIDTLSRNEPSTEQERATATTQVS